MSVMVGKAASSSNEASTRQSLIRALSGHRESFIEAVRAGHFYRLVWVKIKVIDGCNIQCVMCNHWRREEYLRNILTPARLLQLGDELAELGTRHVNWSGGEPTLRADLPEAIGHYRRLGIKSSLISNGTRMTEEYAKRLCDAQLETLLLSLESTDPATHDKVVGHAGAWQKLIDGITYLQRGGENAPALTFTTVLTRLNVDDGLPGLVELAANLGVRRVRMQPVYVAHLKAEEKILAPSDEQIERLRNEYLPRMIETGRAHGVEVHVDGGDSDEIIDDGGAVQSNMAARISSDGDHASGYYSSHACYLPYYHCMINWRGDVYACCHTSFDGMFGNVSEQPLLDVLQGEAAKRFRLQLNTPEVPFSCRDCVMQIAENQQIDRVLHP